MWNRALNWIRGRRPVSVRWTAWILALLLVIFPLLRHWALQTRVDSHYQEALRFYVSGNLDESRRQLEICYGLDGKNADIRKLFSRVLLEQALFCCLKQQYEHALSLLLKAEQVGGDDAETKPLIKSVLSRIETHARAAEDLKGFSIGKKSRAQSLQTQSREFAALINQLTEKRREELQSFRPELFREREYFSGAILSRLNQTRREVWWGMALFAVLFFSGIFLLFMLQRRMIAKWFLHFKRAAALPQSASAPLLGRSAIHAEKIVAIEAELTSIDDGEIAERLLKPFLEDQNPWIRAKSAKALYRYNPELALAELGKLVLREGERIPAVVALGDLGTEDSVSLLVRSFTSFDKDAEKATLAALLKLSHSAQAEENAVHRAKEFLKEIQSRGDWVI